MKNSIYLIFLFLVTSPLIAQVEKQASSSEIYDALLKLNNTATVMYVAAHPDDENTRLIAWLSNHMHVNTVYLSLTRGDGGQNLIGTEKGPLLGLLRTQELLQARSIDGGQQFFSRANDFGYSKTATETRAIWEEEEIISDVVWAIRKFRPDILINRFDHNSNGKTHGHHTFSAIASLEAFDESGKRTMFPEQFKYVQPWQPKRVFFNTSWWFYGSRENFEKADKSNMIGIDVGEYYPIRGISNNEIAAQSRSMHKCQGFGSSATRGRQIEYLEFLKGDAPSMDDGQMTDMFDGIDMTWNRIPGGQTIDLQIAEIMRKFDFAKPSKSIPDLLTLRREMASINYDIDFLMRKKNELEKIIRWCAALYLEATTDTGIAARGDSIQLNVECINRADRNITIQSIRLLPHDQEIEDLELLSFNEGLKRSLKISIPPKMTITTPYWLEEKQENIGMYKVSDQRLIGLPETPKKLLVEFEVKIDDHTFEFVEPIQYKYTDPAIGEIYEPFIVAPPVAVNFQDPVYLLMNNVAENIDVEVRSQTENLNGQVSLEIGPGWKISPEFHEFSISKKGDRKSFSFRITPPKNEEITNIKAFARVDGIKYDRSYASVTYDHIPTQTAFIPAEAVIEHMNIVIPNMRVGYITGAGDLVPQSLRQLGIQVDEIDIETASQTDLNQFHAIIIGIRAFNTRDELTFFSDDLWKYVEEGGNIIAQYNTTRRLKTDIAPLPLTIARSGRIAEENAALTMLDVKHPAFNFPNKINQTDFDGWVQERGIYFGVEWDEAFTPLLSGHDTGEDEKTGMLLVAPYGKGFYVYTGLSFFRQLPAGVPGAYRLFVNLLALQDKRP